MNDSKTASILQRVPVILAVTAASYGLTLHHRDQRMPGVDNHQPTASQKAQAAHRRH